MGDFTASVREIEQIHSCWIRSEVAGHIDQLMALCSEDIEIWPPDSQPLIERTSVMTYMERNSTKIHDIEIIGRRINVSNDIAYLTANFKTTFSTVEGGAHREASGSHLWVLRKQLNKWFIVLVSWSSWDCRSS
jgi:ketosteroid isomerase-like protein